MKVVNLRVSSEDYESTDISLLADPSRVKYSDEISVASPSSPARKYINVLRMTALSVRCMASS